MAQKHTAPSGRHVTACRECGKADDHPKHAVSIRIKDPVNGKEVELVYDRHMDCCAAEGCGVCATQLEFTGGARGLELAAALASPADEHRTALAERHGAHTIAPETEA